MENKVTLDSIEEEVNNTQGVYDENVDTDINSLKGPEEVEEQEEVKPNTLVEPSSNIEEVTEDVEEVSDKEITKPSINPEEEIDFTSIRNLTSDITNDLAELTGIESEDEDINDRVKEVAKEYFKAPDKIDLSDFVISDTVADLISIRSNQPATVVTDWVLPGSGKLISMKEFSGFDLEALESRLSNRNRYNAALNKYSIIYNHMVDTNKPQDTIELLKMIPYADLDSLYFAIYRATFSDHNGILRVCDKCEHVFMDEIDPDKLYEFDTPENEDRFYDIFEGKTVDTFADHKVKMVQISKDYVMALKIPNIYEITIEMQLLDEDFMEKYKEILALIPYISDIYMIDRSTKQLKPVNYMIGRVTDKSPQVDILKAKILIYAEIITKFKTVENSELMAAITSLPDMDGGISYIVPEGKCEKCNHTIEKTVTSGENILFTIHRLAQLSR